MAERKSNKSTARNVKKVYKTVKKAEKHGGGGVWVVVILLLLIAAAVFVLLYGPEKIFGGKEDKKVYEPLDGMIEVHYIDVGQGDSILVKAPDGVVLFDAGPNSAEADLKAYLDNEGITAITYAIFTHMDEDHIGNADMVVSNYKIDNIIMPDQDSTTKNYENLLTAIENSDSNVIEAVSGSTYTIGEMSMKLFAPNEGAMSNSNNHSVVTKITYGGTSFLMTGDAEAESEKVMVEKYGKELKSDVLKCGHHGSHSSTSSEFLKLVDPDFAVISCGKDNKYGHPHEETLSKLESANIPYYRTDKLGSIIFTSDGATVKYANP